MSAHEILIVIFAIFAVIGAADRIIGNRFGLGKEFERAFMLLGTMALSMIGMIVISPLIARLMEPVSRFFENILHMDASIIPASLFANDMGGAPLSVQMASDTDIGLYNALVVSSMMGCTISFTIPFSLGVVNKEHHKELMLGLLCGIVTIPVGCLIGGLFCPISIGALLLNAIPLVLFSAIIALGLIFAPNASIRIFKWFGVFISAVITFGLALGIIRFLTGFELIPGLATVEEGAAICLNAAVVLSGSFPLMYVLAKVLGKSLKKIGAKIGINEHAVVGIVSGLASSATTFGLMEKMDKKGVVLNAAFSVSGAFILGGHLAFTLAFDGTYIFPVLFGKFIVGILSLFVANAVYRKTAKTI